MDHIYMGRWIRSPQGARRPRQGLADMVSGDHPGRGPRPQEPVAVPEAGQWLVTTRSRLAGNGYSWLQAVYWVAETECYQPARQHGPRFGRTSVTVARVLAALSPCRPGVGYLAQELQLSERTIKYHLGMLREAGLLAYLVRGTRAPGGVALASEFALVIPPHFDAALGVRTAGEGVLRRPVGIDDEGRGLMTALGVLAAGAPRRSPRSGRARRCPKTRANCRQGIRCCTPMENPSGGLSPTLASCLPPDALGTARNVHLVDARPPDTARGDSVGSSRPAPLARRFRLARDLIEQIPWLGRAALPRVAWVAREVADAGWHVAEVAAWLSLSPAPTRVRRPSAFLAHRLKGAHLVAATPAQRANLVEAWRDRRAGTAPEQQEWEGRWRPPSDPAVQAAFACAMASPGPRTAPAADCSSGAEGRGSQEHDGPSPAEMAHLRAAAVHDPSLIRAALDTCGAEFAARIFSTRLVEVVRSARGGSPGGGRLRLHALTVGTAHP